MISYWQGAANHGADNPGEAERGGQEILHVWWDQPQQEGPGQGQADGGCPQVGQQKILDF